MTYVLNIIHIYPNRIIGCFVPFKGKFFGDPGLQVYKVPSIETKHINKNS